MSLLLLPLLTPLQLVEAFGAGTAAIVSPVSEIGYLGKAIVIPHGGESSQLRGCTGGASMSELFRSQLLDIQVRSLFILLRCLITLPPLSHTQYGRTEHEWSKVIN
jgi:hypothetical protein